MNTAGKPSAADRRRPWLLIFSLSLIIAGLITVIILFSFIILWPPRFQVDSISISFDGDNNVSKWIISFSVSNPNPVTLRYRKIEVSVAGRQPLSSTAARIIPPFKHSFRGRSSRNAMVYVALLSPRPRLVVDGTEFDVGFETECASPIGRKATTVVACGNKDVQFSTSNDEVAMIGGRCDVRWFRGSKGRSRKMHVFHLLFSYF